MWEYNQVIDDYVTWIKDNTYLRTIGDGRYAEISTPFLDRHNDHLEIYVTKKGDTIRLSDDGFTLSDLKASGVEMTSTKRQQIFRTVLNGFGVQLSDQDELYLDANPTNIGQKKHYLIQAILAVNDMYVMSQENIYSLFKEDVERFFGSKDIYYTKDIKIGGKSGFDHNIDFVISASRSKPERLIKTVNVPKKDTIGPVLFTFADIAAVRETTTKNIIIYNDIERSVSTDVASAIKNYGVIGIPWSEKENRVEEFQLT